MISVNEEFIPVSQRFSKKYRLNKVLELLNNPQTKLPTINVVGTNGKGSTSFYLSKALLKKYKKVGLFISPAFLYQNERIQINNQYINDHDLTSYLKKIEPYIKRYQLTFFEVWTLIAILYFVDQHVDVVVMEAGIGGMLDATNLMSNQIATLLTAVGFDHVEVLGNSIESILNNKIKIVKPGTGAKLFISSDNWKWRQEIEQILKTFEYSIEAVWTNSWPEELTYQKGNKGLVEAFVKTLGINDETYLTLKPPLGRFTVLKTDPLVLIDGAHNENGIENLLASFKTIYPNKNPVILAGFSEHRDFDEYLNKLNFAFPNQVYITEFDHFKSWKIRDGLGLINHKVENWKEFLKHNLSLKHDIIICGSLYFIPQVYEWLKTGN